MAVFFNSTVPYHPPTATWERRRSKHPRPLQAVSTTVIWSQSIYSSVARQFCLQFNPLIRCFNQTMSSFFPRSACCIEIIHPYKWKQMNAMQSRRKSGCIFGVEQNSREILPSNLFQLVTDYSDLWHITKTLITWPFHMSNTSAVVKFYRIKASCLLHWLLLFQATQQLFTRKVYSSHGGPDIFNFLKWTAKQHGRFIHTAHFQQKTRPVFPKHLLGIFFWSFSVDLSKERKKLRLQPRCNHKSPVDL